MLIGTRGVGGIFFKTAFKSHVYIPLNCGDKGIQFLAQFLILEVIVAELQPLAKAVDHPVVRTLLLPLAPTTTQIFYISHQPELYWDDNVHLVDLHFNISKLFHWLHVEPARACNSEGASCQRSEVSLTSPPEISAALLAT